MIGPELDAMVFAIGGFLVGFGLGGLVGMWLLDYTKVPR